MNGDIQCIGGGIDVFCQYGVNTGINILAGRFAQNLDLGIALLFQEGSPAGRSQQTRLHAARAGIVPPAGIQTTLQIGGPIGMALQQKQQAARRQLALECGQDGRDFRRAVQPVMHQNDIVLSR